MVSKSTTHSHNESAFSQDLHCMKSYLPSENHIVSNSENSKDKGNTFSHKHMVSIIVLFLIDFDLALIETA